MKTLAEIKAISDQPVVTANEEGRITFANPPFLSTFGWDEESLVGQPLTMIIPPEYHDAHNLGFSRFLVSNKSTILNQDLPLQARDRNGNLHNITIHIVAERAGEHWEFAALISLRQEPPERDVGRTI